ncbi:MAG: hypothetical protein Q9218_006043 [Villophora microphyllina]
MPSPRKRTQSATSCSTRSQPPQKIDHTTAAKGILPNRQLRANSEPFAADHPITAIKSLDPQPTKAPLITRAEENPINDQLSQYHSYLLSFRQRPDPDHHDSIKTFITNLATSKTMFDTHLYNDITSLLHNSSTSRTTSTSSSSSRPSRVFSPDLAYEEGMDSPRTTVTMATTNDSLGKREKSVTFEEEEEVIGLEGYDDDSDGELLEFAPALLAKAEREMRVRDEAKGEGEGVGRVEGEGKVKGQKGGKEKGTKRRIQDAVDLDSPQKRRKRGAVVGAATICMEEKRMSMRVKGISEKREKTKRKGTRVEDEVGLGISQSAQKHVLAQEREFDMGSPKPGSGLLMPPEIAEFEPGTGFGLEEGEGEEGMDEEFWPGDPEFIFGETKFLEALKNRQIEEDLAGGELFCLLDVNIG